MVNLVEVKKNMDIGHGQKPLHPPPFLSIKTLF